MAQLTENQTVQAWAAATAGILAWCLGAMTPPRPSSHLQHRQSRLASLCGIWWPSAALWTTWQQASTLRHSDRPSMLLLYDWILHPENLLPAPHLCDLADVAACTAHSPPPCLALLRPSQQSKAELRCTSAHTAGTGEADACICCTPAPSLTIPHACSSMPP